MSALHHGLHSPVAHDNGPCKQSTKEPHARAQAAQSSSVHVHAQIGSRPACVNTFCTVQVHTLPSPRLPSLPPRLELRSLLPFSCSGTFAVVCALSRWTTQRTRYVYMPVCSFCCLVLFSPPGRGAARSGRAGRRGGGGAGGPA